MLLCLQHEPALGRALVEAFAEYYRPDRRNADRPRDFAQCVGLTATPAKRQRAAAIERAAAALIASHATATSRSAIAAELLEHLNHSATRGAFHDFAYRGASPPSGGIGAHIFDALMSGAPAFTCARSVDDVLKNSARVFKKNPGKLTQHPQQPEV